MERLEAFIRRTQQVVRQTQLVESGQQTIPGRLVSLFDPGARPIQTGKAKQPTEFGRKVLLTETEEGLITGHEVYTGNPADTGLLVPAADRHIQVCGCVPNEVATDRGFSSAVNEAALLQRRVQRVSLPRPGKKRATRRDHERQSWFRRLQRWRAGREGGISLLKRKYGLRRTASRTQDGPEAEIGWGILTHNLDKAAARM